MGTQSGAESTDARTASKNKRRRVKLDTFKALLATQENGKFSISIQNLERSALPPGEVLIRVAYSSLNYKDGLAVTGKPGVIRTFPMVPGVDLAGVVEESNSPLFKPGEEVIVGQRLRSILGTAQKGNRAS